MKFLITGGAGFIGSNFCEYVVKKYPNDDFLCLDKLTYASNLNNIDYLRDYSNFRFVRGDITNKGFINKLFKKEKFDVVINFAAESHVDNSIKDSSIFVKTNVYGVQVLLEASRVNKVKRFHQISTDEVYGDLEIDSKEKFYETSNLSPNNPYSASKASADLLTLAYYRTHNLGISISRSSNNFGKYQHKEKLIPCILDKAMKNESVPIYGDGLNIRDWIYVKDCIRAIDLIVREGKEGEIYNISSHNEISNIDLAKFILGKLDKENLITFVKDRLRNDRKYSLSTEKIENELNWKPEHDFYESLLETIEYYKNKSE